MVSSFRTQLHRIRATRDFYKDKDTHFYSKSYSQEGEDMIIKRLVGEKRDGFYIDIGAHHPKRFSNTQYYYEIGWRGINVDAMPGAMGEFNKTRPIDINVETGVGFSGKIDFYIYDEPAVNTFSKKIVDERKASKCPYKVTDVKNIAVIPLHDLFKKYLPKSQVIDFMTIDVEGKDLEVLKSNDWNKYRPKILLVECYDVVLQDLLLKNKKVSYLAKKGYAIVAKTKNTVIFLDQNNNEH
jgi:hypothetical protein